MDTGNRKYEFQTEMHGERDKWVEVLTNSRRTAKEISQSITKKPRNLCKLIKIEEQEGINKLKLICEEEKDKLVFDYKTM